MRDVAKQKFPEVEDSVVPVCFYLRFLCPTLLQPVHFGLVRGSFSFLSFSFPSFKINLEGRLSRPC